MAFRDDGYIYQLLSMSEMLYKPFDEELKIFRFSFTCCEKLFIYIFKQYIKRSLKHTVRNISLQIWLKPLSIIT